MLVEFDTVRGYIRSLLIRPTPVSENPVEYPHIDMHFDINVDEAMYLMYKAEVLDKLDQYSLIDCLIELRYGLTYTLPDKQTQFNNPFPLGASTCAVVCHAIKLLSAELTSVVENYGDSITADHICDVISQITAYEYTNVELYIVNQALSCVFDYINAGLYSCVYRLSDTKVIKINVGDMRYSRVDGAFVWLKMCVEHQGNPFVPKVYSIAQRGLAYVAIMERLDQNLFVFNGINSSSLIEFVETCSDDGFNMVDYLYAANCAGVAYLSAISLDHFAELAHMYHKLHISHRMDGDIRRPNILMRGRIPVITDPISDCDDTGLELGRLYAWEYMA